MTPEEINIAIFESQGWTNVKAHWEHLDGRRKWGPDNYCSSLDAIVPVVRGSDSINDVFDELFLIVGNAHPVTMAMATPAQWCEAYLRAKGLWKP